MPSILAFILGPDLPRYIYKHSMAPLWLGQAILGGRYTMDANLKDDDSLCLYG